MQEYVSRQEAIYECLEPINRISLKGALIQLKLYPKEYDRFRKDFPDLTFEILETEKGENYKKYTVRISRK